ncbi:MAG: glutamate synthase small chain, partial [Actinomycetota bacterium]|nr:glutamate synthase small chain [Actinomycetota bacterium]
MADPKGFLKTTSRELPKRRPVDVRIMDWREVYEPQDTPEAAAVLKRQAGRCMDCGIPFCHDGCPLGNLIPEWNDLVWRDDWQVAIERLHATNNFPEFTGRLCPAPCEGSCVLGINSDPVTIKQVEVSIIDRAWDEGWVVPQPPERLTGRTVAVVGSGPAGLAAAQQLTRAGHTVVVLERADAIGGLLRYGIPEFKMEKRQLDRRIDQMRAEGTRFKTGVDVGADMSSDALRARYDAVVLALGATAARDLPVPGRELDGVLQAMEYLPHANRAALDPAYDVPVSAAGKHVIIIGGGDTGADCLGTAHRQGAASVTQLEIMPTPPGSRAEDNPWPTYPMIMRVSSAHEEGGERLYSVNTEKFLGHEEGPAHGALRALLLHEVERVEGRFQKVEGTEREIPADLVFLAMGFTGAQR